MTTRNNTCEGTNTTAVSTSNTGGADQFTGVTTTGGGGSTVTFSNTHIHSGSTAIRLAFLGGVAAQATVAWASITATSVAYVRFYMYATAQPNVNTRLISWVGSGANRIGVQWRSTGKLHILNSSGSSVATGTVNVPLNQLVRVEFDVTALSGTTGNGVIRFYSGANLEGSTPDETISATGLTTGGATVDDLRIGTSGTNVTMSPAWDLWIDRIDFDTASQPGAALVTITGTGAATLDGLTSAATGVETITGTAASTLADTTSAASGAETFTGTAAATLDDVTADASGTGGEVYTGTADITLDDVTAEASGTHEIPGVEGSADITLDDTVSVVVGAIILPPPTYRFEPPSHEEPMRTNISPFNYYRLTWANSIVRIDGTLTSVRTPAPEVISAAGEEGIDYFRGGGIYTVSQETAIELLNAGFPVQTSGGEGYGNTPYGTTPYGGI